MQKNLLFTVTTRRKYLASIKKAVHKFTKAKLIPQTHAWSTNFSDQDERIRRSQGYKGVLQYNPCKPKIVRVVHEIFIESLPPPKKAHNFTRVT